MLFVASLTAGISLALAQQGVQLPAALVGTFSQASTSPTLYSETPALAVAQCQSMSDLHIGEMTLHAVLVPVSASAPEHCRVAVHRAPALDMEINLPIHWNKRFYMMGNGGAAGERSDDAARAIVRDRALANGFVAASTNAGHDRAADPAYTFAQDSRKLQDYGYRAVHETVEVGKQLIRAYYGQAAMRSYWDGCSTGGREGLMEAQRYPDDFDGVIAGAPALDFSNLLIQHLWIQSVVERTPLSAAKLNLVGKAVYAKCDALDGLADGLIADPLRCNFDPKRDVAQCRPGETADNCLTADEAEAMRLIYQGPSQSGQKIFPGLTPGAELPAPNGRASGWDVGADGRVRGGIDVAESQLRYAVFNDPSYDWHSFELKRDLPKLDPLRRLVDATDPNLARFRQRGGKLLMYYGWADTVLNPRMGIDYYDAVKHASGSDTGLFFRLFMVPGMFHCRGGYGPDHFDAMTAIVDWVESDKAPDQIVATQINHGAVVRTRPLCPYPLVARYKGHGSPDQATSFSCAAAK